jgi:aryl-alcohol dehydrogenase-like predicted oxidoreductase
MKLILGTVQFGLNYGVSNINGKVERKDVEKILSLASTYGIDTLDTASGYGDSEKVIGKAQKKTSTTFNIITKVVPQRSPATSYLNQVRHSLTQLKVTSSYAVMLHDANQLLDSSSKKNYQDLLALKNFGLCQKIGVSIYNPNELISILKNFKLDIIQLPLNIFDQRFLAPQVIKLVKKNNIEVHARSLFLQGLLLMDNEVKPIYFNQFSEYFNKFDLFCKENQLTRLEACISFVQSVTNIDKFVIGVTNSAELNEIIEIYKKISPRNFSSLRVDDKKLLNPSLWMN